MWNSFPSVQTFGDNDYSCYLLLCDPYVFSWESKHQASEEIKKMSTLVFHSSKGNVSPTKDDVIWLCLQHPWASRPTDTLMLVCPCFKKVSYGGLRRWCDLDTRLLLLLHHQQWCLFCTGGNLVCLIAFNCIQFWKIPACQRLWESYSEINKQTDK